jgi:hypothetical protein
MKKIIALFSFVLLFSTSSCSLDDDGANFYFEPIQVIEANFPDSFEVGQVYEIEVTGMVPDGCTQFHSFEFARPSLTDRDVVMYGITYNNINCTQAIEEVTATFNFEVLYEETYYFKFWTGTDSQGNNTYLEYEIPVVP